MLRLAVSNIEIENFLQQEGAYIRVLAATFMETVLLLNL